MIARIRCQFGLHDLSKFPRGKWNGPKHRTCLTCGTEVPFTAWDEKFAPTVAAASDLCRESRVTSPSDWRNKVSAVAEGQ